MNQEVENFIKDNNDIFEEIILLNFNKIVKSHLCSKSRWYIDKISSKYEIDIKYQFDMTVESYIPQPVVRKKAILSTSIDIVNQQDDEVLELIKTLEDSVKGT